MDSVALQGVLAPYADTESQCANGHTSHSSSATSTGEGSSTMKRKYAYSGDREAAEQARRALQLALDRRDNGGSARP